MGKAHIYMRRHSSSFGHNLCWDHAPGVLIVEEAGGIVTDLDGKTLDFTVGERMLANNGILAAPNSLMHEKVQPLFSTQ